MATTTQNNADELFDFNAALECTAEPPGAQELDRQRMSRDHSPKEAPSASGTTGGQPDAQTTSIASEQAPVASQSHGFPPDPSQAMLIFVIGDHRLSETVELGVLNEHPEALKNITATQSLTSSAFLTPAIQAVMAELQPSLMVQVAVQLTIISFRLVAQELSSKDNRQAVPNSDKYQELAKVVHDGLEQALPFFEWQGRTNQCGRARYLMALLQEAIRIFGIETESLVKGMKSHASAKSAVRQVTMAIASLGYSPVEVCGEWAAENLIPAWPSTVARSKKQRRDSEVFHNALSKQGKDHSRRSSAASEKGSDDDELPSPSKFVSAGTRKRRLVTPSGSGDAEGKYATAWVYVKANDLRR